MDVVYVTIFVQELEFEAEMSNYIDMKAQSALENSKEKKNPCNLILYP